MDLITIVRRSRDEESPRKRQRLNTENSPWEKYKPLNPVLVLLLFFPLYYLFIHFYHVFSETDIGVTACAVSPQNIIAFACYGNLKHNMSTPTDQNMTVIVCDSNTPWDTHM